MKYGERAYVSIRHQTTTEPWNGYDMGFYQCRATENRLHPFRLDIRVNSGGTPATVYGGEVRQVRDLPSNPYQPPSAPRDVRDTRGYINGNFLHAGDGYRQKLTLHITEDERQLMTQDNGRLWLVGFVDYSDQFGARHRAGFCRRASLPPDGTPRTEKNNLAVDVTCEQYNYDYEIDEKGSRKPPAQ